MATFTCEIVSAEASVLSVEATELTARSLDGEFGILPGHQPMLAALQVAPITIHAADGEVHRVAVHHGFLYFQANQLVVLADVAELAGEIDEDRAEKRLAELRREDTEDAVVRTAIRRQEVRLGVSRG